APSAVAVLGGVSPFAHELLETPEAGAPLLFGGASANMIAKRLCPTESLLQIGELFGSQHRGERVVCANFLGVVLAPPIILELKEPQRADLAIRAAVALPCLAFTALDDGAKVRLSLGGGDERRGHLDVTVGGHSDVVGVPIGCFRRERWSQCKN